MFVRAPFALVLLVPLAACASARPEHPPAPSAVRHVDVRFHAELTPWSAGDAAVAPVVAQADDLRDPAATIECRVVRGGNAVQLGLVPALAERTGGCVTDRAQCEAALERALSAPQTGSDATVLTAPRLVLARDGRGSLTVTEQIAYVRSFAVTRTPLSTLADPSVGVFDNGLSLEARVDVAEGGKTVALDLALRYVAAVRPFTEASVVLPGSDAHVALQIPIVYDQTLATNVALAADEALVLDGLVDQDGRALVAIVTCDAKLTPLAAAR